MDRTTPPKPMHDGAEAPPAGRRAARTRRRPSAARLCQALSFLLFLYLLLYVAWPYAERFRAGLLAAKEHVPAELFLLLDPLAVLSASLAGRVVGAALLWTAAVCVGSLLVPRVFCSHVCPLGTTVDLFDWAVGRGLRRLHVARRGWWVHAKYWVLGVVAVAAGGGVLLAGHVAAIPLASRGYAFVLGPVQLAWLKHRGMVPPMAGSYWVGVALLAAAVGLGVLGRRFWCRNVCPSGAVFSLVSVARLRERRVTSACIGCGRCLDACPFDAIRADYSTRWPDCTFCRSCARACPVDAIELGWRRPAAGGAVSGSLGVSRRAFLGAAAAGAATGVAAAAGMAGGRRGGSALLRPPGSVREDKFLGLCVRCGLCMKACPGSVLQPAGLEAGLDALWTPVAVPTWAGCHQDCNFCGQVCPTGAIRPLPLEAKRRTPMGRAVVDTALCLPHRGERDCRLCYEECRAAGYHAIDMREIRLAVGDVPEGALSALELEAASRIDAPFVRREACVGCGLCEYRCHTAHAARGHLLPRSAIRVSPEGAERP